LVRFVPIVRMLWIIANELQKTIFHILKREVMRILI
jgi:hypothetical protein